MTRRNIPGRRVVLCVDDDSSILEITALALQLEGWTVLTADSGAVALDIFCSQPVDAVVLDFDMPGMNGGEVAQVMRRHKPQVPKLLFTGCPNLPAEALRAVEDVCAKPISLSVLGSRVRALLSRSGCAALAG